MPRKLIAVAGICLETPSGNQSLCVERWRSAQYGVTFRKAREYRLVWFYYHHHHGHRSYTRDPLQDHSEIHRATFSFASILRKRSPWDLAVFIRFAFDL